MPICRLCITVTKLLCNYHTFKTRNLSYSVEADFNVLFMQHLLSSIIVFIIIWTYWLSFWQIESWPCGKAERSNILALIALARLKFTYLAKRFIPPAIHLFINRYLQATPHHSPMIYLSPKLLVKIHQEVGETLIHSVLLYLHSLIPPRFDCINSPQHLFSLSHWLPCRQNQSGNIWRGTHIPLLWAFCLLDAILLLYVTFTLCRAIVLAVIWIIQVPTPVKPIFGIRNAFWCTIIITVDLMTVDSSHSADISYLSSSSREVLCTQSCWERRCFWKFKCSALSYWKSDQDTMAISFVFEMYPTAVICLFWAQDSLWVGCRL